MDKNLENELLEELSVLYGRDCATAMVEIERRKSGGDMAKQIAGIRHVLVMVGGEEYASFVYERLQSRLEGMR